MILHYLEDGSFNGFYFPNSNNPIPNIEITEDLWNRLIEFGNFKLNLEKLNENLTDNLILGIEDFETYFSKIEAQEEKGTHPLVAMINNLEKENANLLQESLQKDIEIKGLNTNVAQTTLSLVNKDIEIKDLQKDVANLILQTLGGN